MCYQVGTQRELDKLIDNAKGISKRVKVKSITKAEPKPIVPEFLEDWHKEMEKLKAKVTELETTNRNIMKRVFELETKVENLRKEKNY